MLSPSLFGGRRVLVIRSGQDARKDLIAALIAVVVIVAVFGVVALRQRRRRRGGIVGRCQGRRRP